MAEIIFLFLFAIPALLGIAELLHTVKMWLYGINKNGSKTVVIVPTDDNFEALTVNCARQSAWYSKSFADKIIVVNSLLSEKNFKDCEELTKRLEMEFCSKSELYDRLLN